MFKKVSAVLLVVVGVGMVLSFHPELFLPGCILLLCGGLTISTLQTPPEFESIEVALAQLYSELEDVKTDISSLAGLNSSLAESSSNVQKSMAIILPFVSKLDDLYEANGIFNK